VIHDDLLRALLSPGDTDGRFYGVVVGIVTNNKDPDDMHRVKVKFPWLDLDHESHWARVVAMMAGNGRGSYFLPEADDEVLVAFEHGSLEHPYVIGSLWNGKDKAHESNSDGKNNNRSIKSRSGHVVRLCDDDGGERIDVIDKTGNNKIVITSSDNKITIEAQGDIDITSHTGTVTISGQTGVAIMSSAADVSIQATTSISINAQTSIDATATGQVNITGPMVNIN
jgi:uncharacterized protein involved in type VI secretion and phage assembly